MIAMRTPRASLPCYPATIARIFLTRVAIGAKGPMYDAFDAGIDGKPAKLLVARSRTPALDVSRIFADLGIVGGHIGGKSPAIFLDIETAAGLTIIDSETQGPRFAPYRPYYPTQRAGVMIAAHPSDQGAAIA
jgi:hypothetical protein